MTLNPDPLHVQGDEPPDRPAPSLRLPITVVGVTLLVVVLFLLGTRPSEASERHSERGAGETVLALRGAAHPAPRPPSALLLPGDRDSRTAALRGTATWYCGAGSACTRGYGPQDLVAAIDPTTGIAKGTRLTVSHGGRSVTVRVVDVCACAGARLIDLTRGAFSRLASPSRGVIAVTIRPAGAAIALPETDTEAQP